MSMKRCHGRNTGPRWAAFRSPCDGGVNVNMATWCQTTNRSYVLTWRAGPAIPKSDVVGPGNSCLRSFTPWMYCCRAVALLRMLRRTAAISVLLSVPAVLGFEILGERVDQLLHEIHRGGEAEVWDGVVVHLAVVGDAEVPFHGDAVHLDAVAGADNDVVPAVGGFADALHNPVFVLFLPHGGRVAVDVLGQRLRSRIPGQFISLHRDLLRFSRVNRPGSPFPGAAPCRKSAAGPR